MGQLSKNDWGSIPFAEKLSITKGYLLLEKPI
jgi:hypothetical protein